MDKSGVPVADRAETTSGLTSLIVNCFGSRKNNSGCAIIRRRRIALRNEQTTRNKA